MELGIQVIQQSGADLIGLGDELDASSFDGVWLAGGGDNYLKAAMLLSHTDRIKVGTAIIPCLIAAPSMHAASARFLQANSGGRFVLGMGSQTKGQIRMGLGIEPTKPAKMALEVIEITRAILRNEALNYHGEFYSLTRSGGNSDPGVPPPPLYYSGVNKMNLRIAGQYTDGFLAHPIFTRRYFEEVVWPEINKGLERAGKSRTDFHMVAMPMTWLVENESEREEAVRRAKRNIAYYFTTRAYGTFLDLHGWGPVGEAIQEILRRSGARQFDFKSLEETISAEIVEEICLIGTPDEVHQKARERYADLADTLDFYSVHDSSESGSVGRNKERDNIRRLLTAFKGVEF